MRKMKRETKGKILKIAALVIDWGVPLIVAITYIPAWVERSTWATVSGLALIIALVCCIPFYKQIWEHFKRSPSACLIWTVLFLVFLVLESIVGEIKIVCFFGALANLIGSVLYRLGNKFEKKADEPEK